MTKKARSITQACLIVIAIVALAISTRVIDNVALFFMQPDDAAYWLLWGGVLVHAISFAYLMFKLFPRSVDLAGASVSIHVNHAKDSQ